MDTGGPDGVDVEHDAALAELEARRLQRRPERHGGCACRRRGLQPGGVRGGLHGCGVDDEDGGLEFRMPIAEAEHEDVARVVL